MESQNNEFVMGLHKHWPFITGEHVMNGDMTNAFNAFA